MPTFRFLGRVFPPGVNITLGSSPVGLAHRQDIRSKWELHVVDSNVTMLLELNKFEEKDFGLTIEFVQDISDIAINLLILQTGHAARILFERVIMPDGELKWPVPQESEFPKYMTALREIKDYQQVMMLAVADRNFARILLDVTDGLRHRFVGTISAARAIDGICNYFIPADGTRRDGWPIMRAALNASDAYVRSISELSKGPRHGNWADDPGEPEVRKVIARAWILVNRFCEYRKRNDQPLTAPDFPLLEIQA